MTGFGGGIPTRLLPRYSHTPFTLSFPHVFYLVIPTCFKWESDPASGHHEIAARFPIESFGNDRIRGRHSHAPPASLFPHPVYLVIPARFLPCHSHMF